VSGPSWGAYPGGVPDPRSAQTPPEGPGAPDAPAADPGTGTALAERPTEQRPGVWQTVVWNDPVNLMSYVTYVLQKLFGYPEPKATALMLDVHHKGKAAVSSGDKEKVEGDVAKLHAAGLWATMQRV
jgi:ATP-dependent Clp protease adaptor protein ClpS